MVRGYLPSNYHVIPRDTNLESRTHWWNLTSSSSTALLLLRPVLSNRILSFSPSRSSGIPLSMTWSKWFSLQIPDCPGLQETRVDKLRKVKTAEKPRNTFILTDPTISLCNTLPLAETNRLIDSTTSRKTSFLRYLMFSGLQDTALVTVGGGRGATSILCDSCVMNLRKITCKNKEWRSANVFDCQWNKTVCS